MTDSKMKTKLKLKKGDKVFVIAGNDKGKTGEILKIITKTNRAIVSGINKALRHTRPSKKDEKGGIKEKFMPIHISNLAFLDAKINKPSKVGYRILDDGSKKRFMKTSGEIIG